MIDIQRTKIVATLGPATEDENVLRLLIQSGVDIARLNFSHGEHEWHARQIETVRKISAETGHVVAIMQDLQGPKIRIGAIGGDGVLQLREEDLISIAAGDGVGSAQCVYASYPGVLEHMRPSDSVFLVDGLIELKVISATPERIDCQVVHGGMLRSHAGMNLPGVEIRTSAMTEKDEADLRFGLKQRVDMVALSFVRRPEDADPVRQLMREYHHEVPLIVKIEKREALQRLDEILQAFDGAMVARGDLGVEIGTEKVPMAQKRIIDRANALERPVITATQMLESMVQNPRPTRAEASDVANAVLDGTDAVMLSGETAIGAFPVAAVQVMNRIIREVEQVGDPRPISSPEVVVEEQAVCESAVTLARQVGATALAAFTRSGRTAQRLSKLHPLMPIFALCGSDDTARQLILWRGVAPIVIEDVEHEADFIARITLDLRSCGLLGEEGSVILVGAAPGSPPGKTNFIRLLSLNGDV
jgi:pyruvate kinase